MKRSIEIQCWRGLAILMIFFAHTSTFLSENLSLFSDFGESGVYIFIVISGILLFQNTQKKDYAGNIKEGFKYAIRKVKYLYPIHVVLWLVMFIVTTTRTNLIRNIIYSIFNLSLTQDFIPFSGIINSFNGPSWYLSMCLFIWILTPPFIKLVNHMRLNEKKLAGKLFLGNILIWIMWLNIGNYVIEVIRTIYPKINPDWFERWLLYSCPLLDFIIYLCAFWGSAFFSEYKKKQNLYVILAKLVIIVSVLLKGNIPILYHVPFVIAIVFLITYSINHKKSMIMNQLPCKILIFYGNISSYFFLVHGVVNLLINRTILVSMRPWTFFIAFFVSSFVSYLLYYYREYSRK